MRGEGTEKDQLYVEGARLCVPARKYVISPSTPPTPASQGQSFEVLSLIWIVGLGSHLAVGKTDISQSPIHAAAPPAHSDGQTWPFIIPLAVPQLTVGGLFFFFILTLHCNACIGGF